MSVVPGRNPAHTGTAIATPPVEVTDAATLQALSRLAVSRGAVRRWATTVGTDKAKEGSAFKPRSMTMRALLAIGGKRIRWLGPAYSAWSMLRALRRRS